MPKGERLAILPPLWQETMNTDQRAAILEELEKHAPLPDLRPDEITANDIAVQYKMTRVRATKWARVLVKNGRLEEFKRYDPRIGKIVNAWRRPVDSGPCTESEGGQPLTNIAHRPGIDDIPY